MSLAREASLPAGWASTTLGEIGQYLNGRAFGKSEWALRGRPIIRIQDLTGTRVSPNYFAGNVAPRFEVRSGDLLVSWAATLGAYIWHGPDAVLNQHIFKVETYIDKKFHYHLLQYVLGDLQRQAHGTGMVHITKSKFDSTFVAIPPLVEQRRIVHRLEQLFSQIEVARAGLKHAQVNLSRYRVAVLKAACEGRLVPTEAELARSQGRDYEPATAALGSQGTSEIHVKKNLPEGWTWTTFEQIAKRVTVGHVGPMKHEYIGTGVPFLRSQNVRENRFDPEGLRFISQRFHKRLSKSALHPGDIVLVRSGSVGVACVIPDFIEEANCADLVIVQSPIGLVPKFGAYYMNSLAKALVRQGKVGIALTHFNTKSVASLPVPLPPYREQERIVAKVESQLSFIDQLEAMATDSLRKVEQLRTSILRSAFEGRLVSQDPNDEPALVLLDRIRLERASVADQPRRRGRRPAAKTETPRSRRAAR